MDPQSAKQSAGSMLKQSELGQIENKSEDVTAQIMAAESQLKQILIRLRGSHPEAVTDGAKEPPMGSIARIRLTLHNAGIGISAIHGLIQELEKIV